MTPENAKKKSVRHETQKAGVFKNSMSGYVREKGNVGVTQCTVAGWGLHLARLASHSRSRFPADSVGDGPCEGESDIIWRGE